ncbi:amidohydrolase [Allopusillimonas ginsengisoli]|uniref:amidohydrolase n=1 Tax=Allopusillimonas ginsengisoli TaxID=453575 RepID=UPI001021129E|nr:amidohydrolase [Allopusillimonas ginsengisoli]TEA77223.1 amidohydrolase [Allopusillimonas ginsengisoli]
MSHPTTVFVARRIITMNPMQPTATHVAVRDGKVLAVGDAASVAAWGPAHLNKTFADKILMPGMIEGHSHLLEGGMWKFVYVGYHSHRDPNGRVWPGLETIEEVVTRLREAETELGDKAQPLLAWGFDPIYFGGERMAVGHLDRVSTERPVIVLHASGHLMNVNSTLLQRAGINSGTPVEGIPKDSHGNPTGELQEFAAQFLVFKLIGNPYYSAGQSEEGMWSFGRLAQQAGVTTATDLVNSLQDEVVDSLVRVTADPEYPLRLVPAYAPTRDLEGIGLARVTRARAHNTDKLHFGLVKLIIDGSIQGFTARMRWPGYHNGAPNGLWLVPPQQLAELLATYHNAGLTVHIHTNGDEATDVAIDAVEVVLRDQPRWDHRHTLQHCQLADASQFKRMAALGICVNLFSNHLYYWGEAHYAATVGPDRANRMNAANTARQCGVVYSMHADAPVTPIGPLFTAWCAVNRYTDKGRVMGESERIPVYDALRAMTLGAAHTLKLDHVAGSIEVGKYADFAVLEQDPLEVAPDALRDVVIWGTVLGGRIFPAGKQT